MKPAAPVFAHLAAYPGDPILTLNEAFQADPRPDRINLSIGVYLDESGHLPVMAAVAEAECRVAARAAAKPYLPMAGHPDYRHLAACLVLGAESAALAEGRIATVQTIGGSGALKVGGDLLRLAFPDSTVWVSGPTWDNHIGLMQGCGFPVRAYPYLDAETGGFDCAGMLACLEQLPARSIVLLHACCHNPTGVDPSASQWESILEVMERRGLVPFVDMAYQGFGQGLEADAHLPRRLAERGLTFLLASSFSKNLSLYGERCGLLAAVCANADEAQKVQGQLQAAVRRNYSSPPLHGSLVVQEILGDTRLHAMWTRELEAMRERIAGIRMALRSALEALEPEGDFAFITRQRGMFSYTGLSAGEVDRLREECGIYLLRSGRACMTGITAANVGQVARAFAQSHRAQRQPAALPS